MGAQAINTLGGICQILGVLIVVRDLLAIHRYLGDLERMTAWVRARRAWIEAILRRLLRRPRRGREVALAGVAMAAASAASATLRVTPGPFVQQPDQPVQDQLAAHAAYLNRLRDWLIEEIQQRDQTIQAEREWARSELQADGNAWNVPWGKLATRSGGFGR